MERETSEYKSRTTRLAKWRELVTRAQEEMEVTAGVPESLQTFSWHIEKIFVLIWFLLECSLFSEHCLFVASHFLWRMWQARPGHVVLFNLPNSADGRGIEIGLVISCWRGIKQPRIFSEPTQVNACSAFRVVTLDMGEHESVVLWSYTLSTVRFCFFPGWRYVGMSSLFQKPEAVA